MDRKNFTIAGAAILALAIAGCTTEETPQATNPSPVAKPALKSPPATQTFNNPLVPGKQVSKVAAATYSPASTLIQPTNATERLVLVSKGRTDPFAEIIAQGGNSILPSGQGRPVPNLPPLPIPKPPAVTVAVTTTPRSAVKAITSKPRKIQIQKLLPFLS